MSKNTFNTRNGCVVGILLSFHRKLGAPFIFDVFGLRRVFTPSLYILSPSTRGLLLSAKTAVVAFSQISLVDLL